MLVNHQMCSRYQANTPLTEGSSGNIYCALDTKRNRQVIIKQLHACHTMQYEREVEILSILKGRNIIQMLASFQSESKSYIVLEKMNRDLFSTIEQGPLSTKEAIPIFKALCKAVKCCHSEQIAHMDIKPENVLLSTSGDVKLCDFGGSAMWSADTCMVQCSTFTELYAAPEVGVDCCVLGEKADIWSLGILLHVILTGCWPYTARSSEELQRVARKGLVTPHKKFPKILLPLILEMCDIDPSKRPSIHQVLDRLSGIKTTKPSLLRKMINRSLNL